MKCPKCGSDVPEGAGFCINCGATVKGEGEKAATEAGPPEKERPPELAANEAPDELPEPDRKLEETPPEPAKPESAPAKPEPEPAKPEPEPAKPEPEPAKPESAPTKPESAPAKPEPGPAKPEPGPAKPESEKKPADRTEKPYRDYRKPITAVIFIVVILCSIFACCLFCVLISSMQGYAF
jgi:hypothetical protein